jgi:hypothetical protein
MIKKQFMFTWQQMLLLIILEKSNLQMQ